MAILEFIIALLFACLLISLLSSWLIDIYANRMNRKGRFLQFMMTKLLGSDHSINWVARLYSHPVIETLSYKTNRLTSLIPAEHFSHALSDLIIEEGREYKIYQNKENGKVEYHEEEPAGFMEDIKRGLYTLPESDVKRTVKLYFEKSEGDKVVFLSGIEKWFNEYMLRANHTYKRLLRKPLFVIGFLAAIVFNIDAITLTHELYSDAQLRHHVAEAATDFMDEHQEYANIRLDKEFFESYKESLGLTIGWKAQKFPWNSKPDAGNKQTAFAFIVLKLLGLILTGIVTSFGAPFWYETLQKVVNLKKSVKLKTE